MKSKVDGLVHSISDVQKFGNFEKKELILKVAGARFDNYLLIELKNDLIDFSCSPGDSVEVEFYLNGRLGKGKHEGRCFVSLSASSINFQNGEPSNASVANAENDNETDIPF